MLNKTYNQTGNMAGATCRAEPAYPSEAPEVCVAQSFVLCVVIIMIIILFFRRILPFYGIFCV